MTMAMIRINNRAEKPCTKNTSRRAAAAAMLVMATSFSSSTAAEQAQRKASHVRCGGKAARDNTNTIVNTSSRRALNQATPESVPYTGAVEAACRLAGGNAGDNETDYDEVAGLTLQECVAKCTTSYSCRGYGFLASVELSVEDDVSNNNSTKIMISQSMCQLWNHYAPETEAATGAFCFFKLEACCDPYPDHDCDALFGDVYRPVSCGASRCSYDNLCLANAAGWNNNDCQDRCPDKPDAIPESCLKRAYNPVACQPHADNNALTCVYENACAAEASGVVNASGDDGGDTGVCKLQCPPESAQVACAPSCTREYDPHVCGHAKCEYSNQCTATDGAGFLTAQCYRKFPIKEESRGQD